MKNQNGFTLIELVIVIVLLGVLAAIAVPRFVNLEEDALLAQRNATAAAITSAMNINYAECAVNNHTPAAANQCSPISTCQGATGAAGVLQNSGTSLTGYTITEATVGAGNGTTATCTLARARVPGTVTFTAVRAGTP